MHIASGAMANVLDTEKQQQILALGRLGWTLRRIEQETGVRRETASRYLKQAGIEVRPPGRWGHPAAKAAIGVITDAGADSKAASMRRPAVSTRWLFFSVRRPWRARVKDVSFDLPPGFHSHSSMVRLLGPVHDEVRGVRALQSINRPRRSAAFTQSPGQGGLGIEQSVTRFRNGGSVCSLLCALVCWSRSPYAAWPCFSL
jgi:hypothetical protein